MDQYRQLILGVLLHILHKVALTPGLAYLPVKSPRADVAAERGGVPDGIYKLKPNVVGGLDRCDCTV